VSSKHAVKSRLTSGSCTELTAASRQAEPAAATIDFRFPCFPDVTAKDNASDHCPVLFEPT